MTRQGALPRLSHYAAAPRHCTSLGEVLQLYMYEHILLLLLLSASLYFSKRGAY